MVLPADYYKWGVNPIKWLSPKSLIPLQPFPTLLKLMVHWDSPQTSRPWVALRPSGKSLARISEIQGSCATRYPLGLGKTGTPENKQKFVSEKVCFLGRLFKKKEKIYSGPSADLTKVPVPFEPGPTVKTYN